MLRGNFSEVVNRKICRVFHFSIVRVTMAHLDTCGTGLVISSDPFARYMPASRSQFVSLLSHSISVGITTLASRSFLSEPDVEALPSHRHAFHKSPETPRRCHACSHTRMG